MRLQRKRLFASFHFLLILAIVSVGCSSKSVVHKDRVFVIPQNHIGYLAVIYGAKKNQWKPRKDAAGREILTIPQIGVLCVGDPRPKMIIGTDEYRVGAVAGPFLTVGKPTEVLQEPQIWWSTTGIYFPSHLGMRPVQSTSEPGVVHYEKFYVSAGGVPANPSDDEDRTFDERMSQHCGL